MTGEIITINCDNHHFMINKLLFNNQIFIISIYFILYESESCFYICSACHISMFVQEQDTYPPVELMAVNW